MTDFDAYDGDYAAIDLFAGPGGWDVAAQSLGVKTLGLEWDEAAVATRRAAGLPTLHGDVRNFGPDDFEPTPGLIASPPCQTFSVAGKGAGRAALDEVLAGIKTLHAGQEVGRDAFEDERTGLVLEPLRWALDGAYRWLAFEQVPTVLPVWEAMADVLRGHGYSVDTGVLYAERYGVPQTRKRAILVAHRDREVRLPAPTHTRYRKGKPRFDGSGLIPWVSMFEALGWRGQVGFPRRADGQAAVTIDGVDYRARDLRGSNDPAQVVTEKARSWLRFAATNVRPNTALRAGDEPAPTLAFGRGRPQWVVAAGITGEGRPRPDSAPAPTLTAKGTAYWIDNPAVYRNGNQANSAKRELAERSNKVEWMDPELAADPKASGVRVTVEEAALLQSFPHDYPWQGTKTKQFQQIGNAIPPLLARAILKEVL